ncbi:MAG: Ig-like domain-containing protein, partial [Bacteroidales bacterium]|nr:Ig-like domain-containing protein [Bacteroidales bacterium]
MKKILLFFLFTLLVTAVWGQPNAWINEFHYDNDGADQDEFIEIVIADVGGLTLSDFAVDLYNGNGGVSYGAVTMDNFTVGNTVGDFTIYSYVFSSIQNGAPDGMSLTYQGTLITGQFLSYEGVFDATDGPAIGVTSTDILVSEPGTTPIGHSLQLTGTGTQYSAFTWASPAANTMGAANNDQTLGTVPPDTDPPVWTTSYPYIYSMLDTKGQIAVNMDEPGKVYYILVNDDATAPDAGQVIAGNDYSAVSVLVHDSIDVIADNTEYLQWIEGVGIVPETPYDIYVIAQDDESTPNVQTTPFLLEDSTTAARSLSWVTPEVNDTLELGDTLTFQWTSANINKVNISLYSYRENGYFYINGDEEGLKPISASDSIYKMRIPHDADSGKYDFLIHDAADSLFYDRVGPGYLEDNRSLAFTNPQPNDTLYVGDTLTFEWDAVKVDSILIGAYDYDEGSEFIITADEYENPVPVAADIGYYKLWIPYEANVDSVNFYLYDAEDAEDTESCFDSLFIYLSDTIPPMIEKTTPANGSTGFPPAGQFTLYFTEDVTLGTGKIYLFKADGTPVDTFDVTEIYFDQNLFSFTPVSPLEPGAGYYIEIDGGIVSDWKNLDFEAVTGSDTWSFTVASTDLYFSEYVEGSSNNKALEIYNPTSATVDLSQYGIVTNTNGGSWYDPDPLTGMLEPGDVYLIINPSFNFSLIDSAAVVDTIWGAYATYHNGDDGRALAKLLEGSWDDDHTWSFVDVIGYSDGDPGDGWDVAGVTAATKDHTLIRKATISIGNTDFTESAGTSAENSEWRVFDKDFVTNLGYATPDASDETDILGFVLKDTLGNNITTNTVIDTIAYTVDVEILFGYDAVVDSLVPDITLSNGATSDPATGDTVDFTSTVTLTVTAEDELTFQDWTINVTVASEKSTETDITSFVVDDQIGDAVIDTANHTVTAEVEYLTDLTTLAPVIEVSAGAAIVPA